MAYIPEAERDSRPANLAAVFFGGNLAFSVIVFGWLPITFGLGWWAAVSSSALGLALGTLITAPLALLGPRTGTNNTVSSGAHFGVTGRLVGSALTLAFALAYAAIAVWTSGDALVAGAHRLFGTPAGDGALAVGYALIAAEIALVALYGHATVVALQKIVVPVVGVLLLLGIFAFAGDFHASGSGEYLLGGFWPTWALAVTVAAAGPLSYAPSLGDYTRRISRSHGDRRVLAAAGLGVFGGLLATTLFGAFTALCLTYARRLLRGRPGRGRARLVRAADPADRARGRRRAGRAEHVRLRPGPGGDHPERAPRAHDPDHALAAIALVFLGTFALNAVDSITAMTLVLNGVAAPWVVVNLLGFLVARRREYDPHDLQAFNEGRRGGRYWFTGGWNLRALGAWAAGSAFGLLAVTTDLYTGPLANLAGGVDLSLAGSALVAAAVYLIALAVWPEGETA